MHAILHRKKYRSRGAVLVICLVCLALAAVMMIASAKIALTSHRAAQTASWTTQANWLAESGVERAAAKLAADPKYAGETWNVPAAELGGEENGVVRIQVEDLTGEENRRTVKVEADFPDDPVHYARRQKEIIVDLP
jgi:type II secretory pathway component PulK